MSKTLQRLSYAALAQLKLETGEKKGVDSVDKVNIVSVVNNANTVNTADPVSPVDIVNTASPVNMVDTADRVNGADTVNSADQCIHFADTVNSQKPVSVSTVSNVNTADIVNTVNIQGPGRAMLSARIRLDLKEKFDQWCFLNRCDKQAAMERAIALLVGVDNVNNADFVSRVSPLIDDDIDDVDIIIISEYETLTGRRFNDKDRQAYQEIRPYGTDAILAGMFLTVLQKKQPGPINSFRYFQPQIQTLVREGPPMAIKEYIQYLRSKLSRKKP